MYSYDHGLWMMGGWFIMLLLWIVPFFVFFLAIRRLLDKRWPMAPQAAPQTALDLLEEAYARGEIDRAAFLQRRDDLQGK